MEIEVNVKSKKVSKKRILIYIFAFVFVPVISFSIFFTLNNGFQKIQNTNALKKYETFDISIDAGISEANSNLIKQRLEEISFNGVKRFNIVSSSENKIGWKKGEGLDTQYFVPVSHYYSVSNDFNPSKQAVYVLDSTNENIKQSLKDIYPKIKNTSSIDKVLDKNGKNVALINVKDLKYTNQLLNFNGKYFLDNTEGGISFSIGVESTDEYISKIIESRLKTLSVNTFDKSKILKINQTGVTAITRMLGKYTDNSGDMGYPATKIAGFLKDADVTHVSNEISFVTGCIPTGGMRFCSNPKYIKTLTDIGVDIVELTGNHNNDYGANWNLSTLKTYDKLGIKYFGGGKNTSDSEKILYIDQKGSKIAFIGYNYYDTMLGTGALAGKSRAGSNSYSVPKMKRDIQTAKKNADLVIVDFQFQECYSYPPSDVIYPVCYKPLASPDQVGTFRRAIDLGADIVVGTQAHQPQTYEIYKNKLIYYGLGNLFFDQINWIGTRHGMVLTHYVLDGKLLQTKITTTNYNSDLKTYVSKGTERVQLLNLLKDGRNF